MRNRSASDHTLNPLWSTTKCCWAWWLNRVSAHILWRSPLRRLSSQPFFVGSCPRVLSLNEALSAVCSLFVSASLCQERKVVAIRYFAVVTRVMVEVSYAQGVCSCDVKYWFKHGYNMKWFGITVCSRFIVNLLTFLLFNTTNTTWIWIYWGRISYSKRFFFFCRWLCKNVSQCDQTLVFHWHLLGELYWGSLTLLGF